MNLAKHVARMGLASARVSRVGDYVLAIANFSCGFFAPSTGDIQRKDCFGETPKPSRETRALPRAFARDLIVHA
jgi:uncharacterized protein YutD